ncbi:MAG: hypothetical protein AB7P21_13710 [Lautropia sp.]
MVADPFPRRRRATRLAAVAAAAATAAFATLATAASDSAAGGASDSAAGGGSGGAAGAARTHAAAGAASASGIPVVPLVKSAPAGANAPLPSRSIRDGSARGELWLDESRVAVFPSRGAGRPELRPQPGGTAANADLDASPVYVDRAGRPRALPGGVIVTLPAPLDDARASALLRGQGLTPLRRIGPRMWLVDGPVGTGSLDLAERLARDPRFEAAEPNWWAPPVLK